jgi:glycosyltransferase involved in cell wall biosynthesis
LVSVVIPTHDRCTLLKDALDSVYAQDGGTQLFELEVIVVDDASSDSTPDVVRTYPAARYLRLPTSKGPAVARNAGMALSQGPYIAFLDDDDVWLPAKLSLQVPVLEANPDVCAVRNEVREWGSPAGPPRLRPAFSEWIFHRLLMGNFCGNPIGFLLRRRMLEAVGGFDESLPYAEDYDLWLRLAARFPFAFAPGVVALRRQDPQGHYATGVADGSRVRTMRLIIEKALVPLPDDVASRDLKRRARLACGINLLSQYTIYRPELIRPFVVAVLHEFASVAGCASGRRAVARRVREFVLASPDPLLAARAICEDLRTASNGDRGARHGVEVRRMLAHVWVEVAIGVFHTPRLTWGAAGYALIHSLRLDPSQALHRLWVALRRHSHGPDT